MNDYRPGMFHNDGFYDVVFPGGVPGFHDGQTWNGWAMPFLTRETAERVAPLHDGVYDPALDAFRTPDGFGGEDLWPGQDITFADGTSAHVYPLGAGFWTWHRAEIGSHPCEVMG
jgi:hypothetical protein